MLEEQESIVALATALAGVRQQWQGSETPFVTIARALDETEQLLFHHKGAFGIEKTHFQQGCEEFVLLCNTIAMQQLQQGSKTDVTVVELSGDLLRRAEQHTRRAGYLRSLPDLGHLTRRLDLRLVCLNNLACYFKQHDQPLAAIRYLEKALELQLKRAHTQDQGQTEDGENAIALTHLNMCAVLSQMRRHEAAAEHARAAIRLLRGRGQADEDGEQTVDIHMLLIAHYNLAVELEHQASISTAITVCEEALSAAQQHGLLKSVKTHPTTDVVRLVQEMRVALMERWCQHGMRSPRSPRRPRPLSPRTLRQIS